jgi:hypothetical protein
VSRFKHFLTFPNGEGFIALDLSDEAAALRVARMVAEESGRSVVVRDDQLVEIETIPAPQRN